MAVYAAHLTRTLHGAPSVFTAAAQDALGATVKPALRRLVEYLGAVYPGQCEWAVQWYDELFLLFDCCLQYHYLKHYAASFSESFYGLIRVAGAQASGDFAAGPRLPAALERASLALLVLPTYLRDKAERTIQQWREDEEDGRMGKSEADRARKAAIRVYSVLHLVWELVKLGQLARYLRGAARAHSPALAVLGLALRDAPPRTPLEDDHTWQDVWRDMRAGHLGSVLMALSWPLCGGAVLRAVEYGAFGVQFLRWWESQGALASAALPKPPPPQRDVGSVRYHNKCPVCLQPWRTPTALPVSGFVFCYLCVSRALRAEGACPVTRLPAHERDLVRLYLHD